jgi:hypothetical protein
VAGINGNGLPRATGDSVELVREKMQFGLNTCATIAVKAGQRLAGDWGVPSKFLRALRG